ncbi:hypothetical protein ACIQVC_09825 [Streptomyces sp. NPDC101112]|uniref:hypothetical protein n=1 Tax=Streptomyces sp. NPDC101112 TaxID=3366105 RepID=UPI0038043597
MAQRDGYGGGKGLGELVRGLPGALTGARPRSGTPFDVIGSSRVALLVLSLCLLGATEGTRTDAS